MNIDNRFKKYRTPLDADTAVQEYGKMGFHVEHMKITADAIYLTLSNWRSIQQEQYIKQKNEDRQQRRNERLFR